MDFLSLAVFLSLSLASSGEAVAYRFGKIESKTYYKGFDDGAVYYLRNVGRNRLIDIPYGNYEEGQEVRSYTANFNLPQRFVFEKQFEWTYNIRPLGNQNFLLRTVKPENGLTSYIDLHSEEYSEDYSLIQNKFAFVPTGDGSFLIRTQGGSGDCYLGLGGPSADYKLISTTLPNGMDMQHFFWKIEKTDNLSCFSDKTITIPPNGFFRMLPAVGLDSTYVINLSEIVSRIKIRNNNASLALKLASNTDQIEFPFEKGKMYDLFLFNELGKELTVTLSMKPKNLLNVYGAYDFDNLSVDRIERIAPLIDECEKNGYFVRTFCNLPKDQLLKEKDLFGSKVTIMGSHGGRGTFQTYNGFPDDYDDVIFWNDLPTNISENECVAWYSCLGAALTAPNYSNYSTSLARESVVRGSELSFGFSESINTNYANSHTKFFVKGLCLGKNVMEAAKWATSETQKELWFLSIFDRSLFSGKIYFKENDSIKWAKMVSGSVPQIDDGGYNIVPKQDASSKEENDKMPVNPEIPNFYHAKAITNAIVEPDLTRSFEKELDVLFSKYSSKMDLLEHSELHKLAILKNKMLKGFYLLKTSETTYVFYDLDKKEYLSCEEFVKNNKSFEKWEV